MSFTLKEMIFSMLATFVITMTCAYGCARRAVRLGQAAAQQSLKEAADNRLAAEKSVAKVAEDARLVQKSQAQAYAAAERVVAARRRVNQGAVHVPEVMPVDVQTLQGIVARQEVEIENYKQLTDEQAKENEALKNTITAQAKQIMDEQAQSDHWKKAYMAQEVATNAYHDAMRQSSVKSGLKGFVYGVLIKETADLLSKRK